MEKLAVYGYTDPRQFLLDSLSVKQSDDPKFSVRKWSKDMGLKNHSLLVMLLQGRRPLRIKHATFLSKGLRLSFSEQIYFQTLIQFANAESVEEKEHVALLLQDLNPGKDFSVREVDEFQVISHWIHMCILAMSEIKDFELNEQNIYKRLKKKVPINDIRAALRRLINLNLLKTNKVGKLVCTNNRVTTKDDVANDGVKEYHRQVIELAKEAISAPMDAREFQSFAMSIPKSKVGLAKQMIRQFRAKLSKAVSSEEGDEVYQTNIQFFQLTENPEHLSLEGEGVEEDR